MGEHVEYDIAKRSMFLHPMSNIKMTVKQRIERRRAFQHVFGVEAFAAFFTCLEINEVHIAAQ